MIAGGQRQRIALARAAYASAGLVVADDPLSAMDAHVGQKVFDQCLLEAMRGATRIFCTNQLQFAPAADLIYMLDGGKVVECGTHAELNAAGALREWHTQSIPVNETVDETVILTLNTTSVSNGERCNA